MNKQINVTAKVTGYHPASGLYLVEGEPYTIDEAIFSDEIFTNQTSEVFKTSEVSNDITNEGGIE